MDTTGLVGKIPCRGKVAKLLGVKPLRLLETEAADVKAKYNLGKNVWSLGRKVSS